MNHAVTPVNQTPDTAPGRPAYPPRLTLPPDARAWDRTLRSWTRSLRSEGRSRATVTAYAQSYQRLALWALDPATGDVIADPEELAPRDMRDFFADCQESRTHDGKPLSASTIAHTFRCLRVFFKWLAIDVHDNPNMSIMRDMSQPSTPRKLTPIFGDNELKALLATCAGTDFVNRRDTAIIRVLLDCGLRRAEIVGLKVNDVDIDAQIMVVTGKGVGGGKQRYVSFGAKTADALDRYMRARAKHPDRDTTESLWLATGRRHGALGMNGLDTAVRRRAAEAGIDGVHLHKFRHTAAHAMLAAGMNEGEAMIHFGWQSRAMLDHYAASTAAERTRATVRRLSTGDRV